MRRRSGRGAGRLTATGRTGPKERGDAAGRPSQRAAASDGISEVPRWKDGTHRPEDAGRSLIPGWGGAVSPTAGGAGPA